MEGGHHAQTKNMPLHRKGWWGVSLNTPRYWKMGNEVNGVNGLRGKVSQGTRTTIIIVGREIVMSDGDPHPFFYSFSHVFKVLSPWLGF